MKTRLCGCVAPALSSYVRSFFLTKLVPSGGPSLAGGTISLARRLSIFSNARVLGGVRTRFVLAFLLF